MKFDIFFGSMNKRLPVLLVLIGLCVWFDLGTPPYLDAKGFYLFPIFFAAWFCQGEILAITVVTSVVVNSYVNITGTPPVAPTWHMAITVLSPAIVFIAFSGIVVFLKMHLQQLEHQSETDSLTGLKNRRGFLKVLEVENKRNRHHGRGFALAYIDLENLKFFNDTEGHARGDTLLRTVGNCLASSLRDIDVVSRLAGCRFQLLLPETDYDEATLFLTRLQRELQTVLDTFNKEVSASIGAITASSSIDISVNDLFERVDSLMYSVKRGGKDNLVIERSARLGRGW